MKKLLAVVTLFTACSNSVAPEYYPAFDVRRGADKECVFIASTRASTTKYSWEFGDGTVTSSPNYTARHSYDSYGVYTVTLRVAGEKFVREVLVFPDL